MRYVEISKGMKKIIWQCAYLMYKSLLSSLKACAPESNNSHASRMSDENFRLTFLRRLSVFASVDSFGDSMHVQQHSVGSKLVKLPHHVCTKVSLQLLYYYCTQTYPYVCIYTSLDRIPGTKRSVKYYSMVCHGLVLAHINILCIIM